MGVHRRPTVMVPWSVAVMLIALLSLFLPAVARAETVAQPSQAEIAAFFQSHPFDKNRPASFAEEPSLTQPYAPGRLDDETLRQALNYLKLVRYVAGISTDITIDERMTECAQAGALVVALNGRLDHFAPQPAGMSDELYALGHEGTSRGNLTMGSLSPATSIQSYLIDSGLNNARDLGHRRWVLNPLMRKTGFGQVTAGDGRSYGCMYVVDTLGSQNVPHVAWPARNTPTELFSRGEAWSYTAPVGWIGDSPTVRVVRRSDGRTWNLSNSAADGSLFVSRTAYGPSGCIIFNLGGFPSIEPGDSFDVRIEAAGGSASYTVNFFEMTREMHRLYNRYTGEHFYTSSLDEVASLTKVGWRREGTGWVAPTSGAPVYRLYNPCVAGGDHHYTMDVNEYNQLAKLGWRREGVGWYSGGSVPVYRQYNPYAKTGTHNYTTSRNENDELVRLGWRAEGTGWYAVSSGR